MYEQFSSDYDRFVNWEERLEGELPFIEGVLQRMSAPRVLDAACGTGGHALALARRGYEVVGADISPGMIEQARRNAAAEGLSVTFEVAGFGGLSALGGGSFDALLCLGNSLPHLLTADALLRGLEDFGECLRPGGLLLLQNRNFDLALAQRQRWMQPQHHQQGASEWLFVRFYDFGPGPQLTFNLVTLRRDAPGMWRQQVVSTQLWPQRLKELSEALDRAGFVDLTAYGDMTGAPFDPHASPNLVLKGSIPTRG